MARQRLWPELVGRYREIYGKAVVTSSGGKRNGD